MNSIEILQILFKESGIQSVWPQIPQAMIEIDRFKRRNDRRYRFGDENFERNESFSKIHRHHHQIGFENQQVEIEQIEKRGVSISGSMF